MENWATYSQDVSSAFLIYSLMQVLQNGFSQTVQARGETCVFLLVRGLYGPFGSNMLVHLLPIHLFVISYLVIPCFYSSLFLLPRASNSRRHVYFLGMLVGVRFVERGSPYPRVFPYASGLLFPYSFFLFKLLFKSPRKSRSVIYIFPLQNGSSKFPLIPLKLSTRPLLDEWTGFPLVGHLSRGQFSRH